MDVCMLFLYRFGINGEFGVWQYAHAYLLECFPLWESGDVTEVMIFGKWYRYKLVCPD